MEGKIDAVNVRRSNTTLQVRQVASEDWMEMVQGALGDRHRKAPGKTPIAASNAVNWRPHCRKQCRKVDLPSPQVMASAGRSDGERTSRGPR